MASHLYCLKMLKDSVKLFRAFGIDVSLHWSWFLMAAFIIPQMGYFAGGDALLWRTLLFVSLFVIVILHEFGHALACRSVGGQAQDIILWPLGGAAFVKPPARPGPVLWSIAAGPLVNVLLIPVTVVAYLWVRGALALPIEGHNPQLYWFAVMAMNFGLLVINLMPVYPLDGGQVLMSLLWFVVGRAKALKIASFIGLVAAGALSTLALIYGELLLLLFTAFVAFQAFIGFLSANKMAGKDPRAVDGRHAKSEEDQALDDRLRAEVDPWR